MAISKEALGGQHKATSTPGAWKDTMPGRITREDALDDPDPLFPEADCRFCDCPNRPCVGNQLHIVKATAINCTQ